ncbi:hypothetical protein BLS_005312 [Venturia inaequalis]|uniref:Rhodopsin domain-containing protein n=1 Tax=Venturia inaequalis TaxID=5025 RepID=A0A8H3Z7U0_VENIN|nr:hypothetical protein BLS_005312 [Venturia inaequalis]KAE9982646.1 hypothetical protein EG327_005797 [Venturia inaequalis]RDI82513.1 hypothetical protein Vi05172_g7454 [Venturia inaequalis]
MKLLPLSILETWPIPNYVNPDTRGNALIILNSIFLAFMTVILGLRLYTRLVVKRWFGWDDVFIISAYTCTVLTNVAVALGTDKYGWTRHAWDIPLDMAMTSFQVAFYAKLCFLFAGFFTAQSLLTFYHRLIQETGVEWFRIALRFSTAFNVLAFLALVFTEILICVPLYAYWSFPEPAGAVCINEGPITMVGGLVKIGVDILITTLPIPLIMRMKMQKKQRYMVCLLLGLGYIVCIAGVVRAYYTWKSFYGTNDPVWDQYPAFIAAALENNIAIICACIPTIRPLFPHLLGGPVSRIKNWMSSKPLSNHNSIIPDRSGSCNSRASRTRPKGTSINKLSISAPYNLSSGAGDNKDIIRQTECFELSEKKFMYNDGGEDTRSGSTRGFSNPDYFHFVPRQEERLAFHAV